MTEHNRREVVKTVQIAEEEKDKRLRDNVAQILSKDLPNPRNSMWGKCKNLQQDLNVAREDLRLAKKAGIEKLYAAQVNLRASQNDLCLSRELGERIYQDKCTYARVQRVRIEKLEEQNTQLKQENEKLKQDNETNILFMNQ